MHTAFGIDRLHNPFRVGAQPIFSTQGWPPHVGQPWAVLHNPFGVRRRRIAPSYLIAAWLFIASAAPANGENWPGWRGPERGGVTSDRGVPTTWSATTNVLWKTPLPGTGTSNPVVWDDRVFLTASEGLEQGELHVLCFDRDSGRENWHQRLWGSA